MTVWGRRCGMGSWRGSCIPPKQNKEGGGGGGGGGALVLLFKTFQNKTCHTHTHTHLPDKGTTLYWGTPCSCLARGPSPKVSEHHPPWYPPWHPPCYPPWYPAQVYESGSGLSWGSRLAHRRIACSFKIRKSCIYLCMYIHAQTYVYSV